LRPHIKKWIIISINANVGLSHLILILDQPSFVRTTRIPHPSPNGLVHAYAAAWYMYVDYTFFFVRSDHLFIFLWLSSITRLNLKKINWSHLIFKVFILEQSTVLFICLISKHSYFFTKHIENEIRKQRFWSRILCSKICGLLYHIWVRYIVSVSV